MTPASNKQRLFLSYSAWFAVFLWMGVIFALSAQQSSESAALSGQFRAVLNKFFSAGVSDFLVRKAAHTIEYFLLAILTFTAVSITRKKQVPLFTFFITFLAAVSDEIHQHFVPGRACQLRDMLIDSVGAVAGIVLCMAVVAVYRQLKKRKRERGHKKIKNI